MRLNRLAVASLVSLRTVSVRHWFDWGWLLLNPSRYKLVTRGAALFPEVRWSAAICRHADSLAPGRLVTVLAIYSTKNVQRAKLNQAG